MNPPLFERHSVKPVVVLRRSVHLGPELAGHVGDARADDGGLESRRLRDRPRRHEAAVRPAANSQPIGVGDSAGDQVINTGHHVLEIVSPHSPRFFARNAQP